MQKHILTLLFALLFAGLYARDTRLAGPKLEGASSELVDRIQEHYTIFTINTSESVELAQRHTASLTLDIEMKNFPALRTAFQPGEILPENLAGLAVCPDSYPSAECN